MALRSHIVSAMKYAVFNNELRINGGQQLYDVMQMMYRSRKDEWEESELPSLRTCERKYPEWLRDPNARHHSSNVLWQGFDYTTCIGNEHYKISWNDARMAMDFYGLYASEASRNSLTYDIDYTAWQPTLGLIKYCVSMAHLLPDRDIYTQAQAGEREWLRQIITTTPNLKSTIPTDFDQLSIGIRSWNHSTGTKEWSDFQKAAELLCESQEWNLNGDDAFTRQLRKTAIDQMPLYRYNRITRRQSYHDYMNLLTLKEATTTNPENQGYYTPPQHIDPDSGDLVTSRPPDLVEETVDSSLGIDDVRKIMKNLNRDDKLALANEIWNENEVGT